MISYLLNSFLICALFADLLERRFPEQFRIILTEVTFNALYLYSKIQIYFVKVNKNINNFIESNPSLAKIKSELYTIMTAKNEVVTKTEFIKNGKIVVDFNSDTIIDFAIYSWISDNKKCVNKKIIYDINENITISELSDIRFMLIEIQIREKTYKVDLKTNDYNFYLVDNKFTKQFFLYYLKQILTIDENINDNDEFIVKIIDHNVESFQMNFTDKNESIVLHKNVYLHRIK
jgi:hypothetical protein